MLARLERIDRLEREGAPAPALLSEVRALLGEAEAWARRDRAGEAVDEAIASSRAALASEPLAAARRASSTATAVISSAYTSRGRTSASDSSP